MIKGAPPVAHGEANKLFRPLLGVPAVALAVSGGSDSMALMTLAAEWAAGLGAQAPKLVVLTVDHGLRPGSGQEAQQVAQWAADIGLEAHILEWRGRKPKSAIQAAARKARYGLMGQWCADHGITHLATGHTQDDQAETVMMRLARGSGVEGLSGMAMAAGDGALMVMRPFLPVPRARLRASLAVRGQAFVEDPSNQNRAFERIRMRDALDQLASTGVSRDGIARSARRLRRANQALEAATNALEQQCLVTLPVGSGIVERRLFDAAPAEIRIRLLRRLVGRFGGRTEGAGLAATEALEAWIHSGTGVARTLGGCRLVRRKAILLLGREPGRLSSEPMRLSSGETTVWDHRFAISLPAFGSASTYSVVPVHSLAPHPKRPGGVPDFVWRSTPAVLADGDPIWLYGWARPGKPAAKVDFLAL